MVGIAKSTVPAGASGICGCGEAVERPLLWCFPYAPVFCTAAGDSQDSKRTRGVCSCAVHHVVSCGESGVLVCADMCVVCRLALLHFNKVQ